MPHIVDERPVAPVAAGEAVGVGHGGQRRWLRLLLPALALGVVACLVVLVTGALNSSRAPASRSSTASPTVWAACG